MTALTFAEQRVPTTTAVSPFAHWHGIVGASRALEEGIVELLQSHRWPGNVRELQNVIERAVVLTVGDTIPLDAITMDATVPPGRTKLPSARLRDNVEWIECETIRQALQLSTTKQHAATLLGISRRALSYYLAKYPVVDAEHSHRGYSVS